MKTMKTGNELNELDELNELNGLNEANDLCERTRSSRRLPTLSSTRVRILARGARTTLLSQNNTRAARLAGWTGLSALLVMARVALGATNDLSTALQKGLFEEEANHNLGAAIQAYQSVVNQLDEDRKLAATAVFRLGECYRKQGKTNDAVAQYERVLRDFSDQGTLVTLSRENLTGLGSARTAPASPPASTDANGNLLPSAEAEEVKRIQAMIKDSPDLINARDGSGATPLLKAAEKGQLLVAQFLLANGADVEAKHERFFEFAPLHYAASAGNKPMVELLLSKGANVQARADRGYTPLHMAVEKGFRTVVEVLLAHRADIEAKLSSDGRTPLHIAVGSGFKSLAELLLASRADVNALDAGGNTPLHYAAGRSDGTLAELLLANKADVDAVNKSGETPLDKAAESGQVAIATVLLGHGAEVNARNPLGDHRGWTPLHYAVQARRKEIVALLLKHKADPNARSETAYFESSDWLGNGYTPLLIATAKDYLEIVELLLAGKADPNLKSDNGGACIFNALNQIDPADYSRKRLAPNAKRMLALLLEHGAGTEARTPDGSTPLIFSARRGDEESVELLLAHKADAKARDNSGWTALHRAAEGQHKEVVELLIAAGADVNARKNDGLTPLAIMKQVLPGLAAPAGIYTPGGVRFPQPGAVPSVPTRSLRPPGSNPEPQATRSEIAELLVKHGAVENLPDFSSIRITRKGSFPPTIVFKAGTNSPNRFSLLEVVANYYANASAHVGPPGIPGSAPGTFSERLKEIEARTRSPGALPFPDLSRVKVHRPSRAKPGGQKETEITVNLLSAANGLDCAKDVLLEFGDVLEIPEREHTLAEQPSALTGNQSTDLTQCLKRPVTFEVKGQRTEVWLSGYDDETYLSRALKLPPVQSVLRSSSDFSRLKIRRVEAGTKKAKELAADVVPFWDGKEAIWEDLWLRDGDVIKVPDKP